MHFLHQCPETNQWRCGNNRWYFSGVAISKKWLAFYKRKVKAATDKVFLGYSGWGEGQLETELKDGSWLAASGNKGPYFTLTPTLSGAMPLNNSAANTSKSSTTLAIRNSTDFEFYYSPAINKMARSLRLSREDQFVLHTCTYETISADLRRKIFLTLKW